MSQHSPLNFQELAEKLNQFDADRQWLDLCPEDLAKSIMLEAAELLEHFQWDNTIKKKGDQIPEKNLEKIGSEAADILIYLMKFCREMNIDLVESTLQKIAKTEQKFPAINPLARRSEKMSVEEYLRIKQEYRAKQNSN